MSEGNIPPPTPTVATATDERPRDAPMTLALARITVAHGNGVDQADPLAGGDPYRAADQPVRRRLPVDRRRRSLLPSRAR